MKRLIAPLIPFAFFVMTAAVAFWFIVPTFRSIIGTHAATIATHEQLERRYQRNITRSRALRELAPLEETIAALQERIPEERNALIFVRSIERLAATHRLEERIAIDWSKTTAGRWIMDAPLMIELSGSYPNIIAALRDLERLPLPSVAERLVVSARAADGVSATAPTAARVQLVLQSRALWRMNQP